MTAVVEPPRAGAAIISEAADCYCREEITILSGQNLAANTVLGKVTLGAATPAAVAGNTSGSGTIASVAVGDGAKAGVYRAICVEPGTNAGKFTVEDPDGITVGVATVAVEFVGGGLTFTITDATDFVSGDSFTITVAAGSGKYKAYDSEATDGSAVACGVLFDEVDATDADAPGVAIVRGPAVVSAAALVWVDENEGAADLGTADLAAIGIIAR